MRKNRNNFKSNLPVDFHYNLPVIEFTGNRRAMVEGSTGVLRYCDNVIRINTRIFPVEFKGRGLSINCISDTCVIVEGFIINVEFIN